MKFYRLFASVVIASLMLATIGVPSAPVAAQEDAPLLAGDYVPGEVVVGFSDGRQSGGYSAQAFALASAVGADVVNQQGGVALLSFAPDADVDALVSGLKNQPGVAFAEPNYVYSIPEPANKDSQRTITPTTVVRGQADDGEPLEISVEALKAMRTVRKNGRIMATYPNDPDLWTNWGWWWLGADIVSPNTTASAAVCVIDTGVDYTHPELKLTSVGGNLIKGWDFVNNDSDPMDDNGHGTHVAGVIAAKKANGQGIAGVSSGKVVAVKVLNAQGSGTNYNVAAAINYCANRPDVRVLSMSLGGGPSTAVYNAINYAVNTKGKLIVAAAGNSNTSAKSYPAGYADDGAFFNKLLAVAASGVWYQPDPGNDPDWWALDYDCRADYSNYGSWVSVVGPGTSIYSTMPWNRPFYMGYYGGYWDAYDWLDGTSMATPFIAAAAARRWGYLPGSTNADVGAAVKDSGWDIEADDTCWPASMAGVNAANVADLLDRGAMYGFVYNSTTGLPITGAKFQAYQNPTTYFSGGTLRDTGTVSSIWSGYAEAINLSAGGPYVARVSATGYTATPQPAFWHAGPQYIGGGYWSYTGRANIPNKSANFNVVGDWWYSDDDLDLYTWLPSTPNPLDPGQPAPFIVGFDGFSYGSLEGDSTGSMNVFPFAIWNREGGFYDWMPMESITISNRKAHAPLAANSALPYYAGAYYVGLTDFGQMVSTDHLMYYAYPHINIWKDGVIKTGATNDSCNAEWWIPFEIFSGAGGAVSYSFIDACGSLTPYGGFFGPTSSGTGILLDTNR